MAPSERTPNPNDPQDPRDRRREPRLPAKIEVRFAETEQAAKAFRAYSLNLSVGGLCLKTPRKYELGTPLRIQLLIEGRHFDLEAKVAWARSGTIGVRFENLSEDDQQRLEALRDSLGKGA